MTDIDFLSLAFFVNRKILVCNLVVLLMKAFTIPLLVCSCNCGSLECSMICLRDLWASIQIDGNKGFLIMGWQCLFVDVTPCLALEKTKDQATPQSLKQQ